MRFKSSRASAILGKQESSGGRGTSHFRVCPASQGASSDFGDHLGNVTFGGTSGSSGSLRGSCCNSKTAGDGTETHTQGFGGREEWHHVYLLHSI